MLNARGGFLNSANAKAIARYIAQSRGGQGSSTDSSSTALPSGGAGTVSSIIPDPVVYGEQSAQALQAYQQALAAIASRRAGTLQNYGMTAQVDASGHLKNYGIDPNNPYGAIQQLLGQEGSAIDAAQHNAVARGIGLGGLGHQAESAARLAGGQAQLNLGRQFVGEIGQEAQDQYGASSSYQSALLQAQRNAIASAIQNGYFTPAQTSAQAQPAPLASTTKVAAAKKPVYTSTSLAKNMGVGL